MKKLSSTLPNMIMSLVAVTALSGALLGGVYAVTKEPIARQEAEQQIAAIREVAPPFDNNPEADSRVFTIDGRSFTVYPAIKGGKPVGAAVKGNSLNGFAGEIEVIAGFDADGTIRDFRVLRQGETPGLGTRMATWFRDPSAARSVIGLNPSRSRLYVSKDGGSVDAITAATISSRAFLEALRGAYDAYRDYSAALGHELPPLK